MKTLLTLFTLLLTFTAITSNAALIAYDGFDYGATDSDNLAGMSAGGGSGWDSASDWVNSSDGSVTNTFYSSTGLSYSNPGGNDLMVKGGTLYFVNGSTGPSEIGRDLSASISTLPASGSNNVWVSFLYRHDDTTMGQTYLGFIPSSSNPSIWSPGLFYGHHWSEERLVNRPYGFSTGTQSSSLLTQGSTYLVLARVTFTGVSSGIATNCTSTMWVYESGTDSLPTTDPDPVSGWTQSDSRGVERDLTDVWVVQNGANQGAHTFDEFRIGESFIDVVPLVPEPGLCIAGIVAALAALRIRR